MIEFWIKFPGGKWHAAYRPWWSFGGKDYQSNDTFVTECKRRWSYRDHYAVDRIDDPADLPHLDGVCRQPACQRAWERNNK